MKINVFRVTSYIVFVLFFVLSTVQTVLDIQSSLNIAINASNYLYIIACSFIPISFIIFLMNAIKNKTKYYNLFVINKIKSIIRTLLYISIFSIFMFWSIGLILFIGIFNENNIIISLFLNFVLTRAIYTTIYSFIIVLFFNSLSGIGE